MRSPSRLGVLGDCMDDMHADVAVSAVVGYGQLLEGLAYSTVAIEAVIYMHLLYFFGVRPLRISS